MKKRIVSLIILVTMVFSLGGCSENKPAFVSKTGFYFDTVVSVKVYSTLNEAVPANCLKVCKRYEKVFSPTDEESELYKLNKISAEATEETVNTQIEISDDLFSVINTGLFYSQFTGGRYDITIRPVTALWDFHSSKQPVLPDQTDIDNALDYVDYTCVKLENTFDYDVNNNPVVHNYISFTKPGIQLDLGSIAKGYIADQMKKYLVDLGVTSAVISLGGNILCLGCKDEEKEEPFRIGIQTPDKPEGEYYEAVGGKENSIVTSGVYERSFTVDGKRYHHILDPKTGYPIDTDIESVTIIAYNSTLADVLSTVSIIIGYDESLYFFNEPFKLYAEFVYKDGTIKRTEGFEKYILNE